MLFDMQIYKELYVAYQAFSLVIMIKFHYIFGSLMRYVTSSSYCVNVIWYTTVEHGFITAITLHNKSCRKSIYSNPHVFQRHIPHSEMYRLLYYYIYSYS